MLKSCDVNVELSDTSFDADRLCLVSFILTCSYSDSGSVAGLCGLRCATHTHVSHDMAQVSVGEVGSSIFIIPYPHLRAENHVLVVFRGLVTAGSRVFESDRCLSSSIIVCNRASCLATNKLHEFAKDDDLEHHFDGVYWCFEYSLYGIARSFGANQTKNRRTW